MQGEASSRASEKRHPGWKSVNLRGKNETWKFEAKANKSSASHKYAAKKDRDVVPNTDNSSSRSSGHRAGTCLEDFAADRQKDSSRGKEAHVREPTPTSSLNAEIRKLFERATNNKYMSSTKEEVGASSHAATEDRAVGRRPLVSTSNKNSSFSLHEYKGSVYSRQQDGRLLHIKQIMRYI